MILSENISGITEENKHQAKIMNWVFEVIVDGDVINKFRIMKVETYRSKFIIPKFVQVS